MRRNGEPQGVDKGTINDNTNQATHRSVSDMRDGGGVRRERELGGLGLWYL